MNLKSLLYANAILFIAAGIALALYSPLAINLFGIMEQEGNAMMYWHAVSFSRMYGAALFGYGFLAWAFERTISARETGAPPRRGLLLGLTLANGMGMIVALTQQVSIWGTTAGWVTAGIYAVFTAGYAYFLGGTKAE